MSTTGCKCLLLSITRASSLPNHHHKGDGADLVEHLPGANVVRLIGVYWGDTLDGVNNKDECMTDKPPHYFDDSCFTKLDEMITDATDAGLWVILTARGQVAAGQYYGGLWRSEALRPPYHPQSTHAGLTTPSVGSDA